MKSIMKTIQNSLPRFAALTAVMLVLSLALTGCKYEDGPLVSFRSKRVRIENPKRVVKYTENGIDKTADINACYLSSPNYNRQGFDIYYESPDYAYRLYCDSCSITGTLMFVDYSHKKQMVVGLPVGPECKPAIPSFGWTITRMTYTELRLKLSLNGVDYVLWLE